MATDSWREAGSLQGPTHNLDQNQPDGLLGRDIAGRFRVEAKIGEGGMGSVYRARNIVTGKTVAIKVLQEDMAAYDSFVQRFLNEARATALLHHPHAINIIDCGRDGGIVYLLMEYVHGRTLTQAMRDEGPFSAQRAARILNQVCAAVAEAHSQSIVHRDLKPDNIMLQEVAGEPDYVKVLDFGIAKVLDEQKRGEAPVSRNMFIGTPEYASPEQCNSKPPTFLSDIYSLGVILYEMLAGAPPFTGEPMEVMLKHANATPPLLRTARPDLGENIEDIVLRALSKNPATRPQHVLKLAEEVDAAVRALDPETASHPPARKAPPGNDAQTIPQVLPTEIATRPMGRKESLASQFLSRRTALWLALVVVGLPGLFFGYRFYAWYHQRPGLPPTPALKATPPLPSSANAFTNARQLFEKGNREGAVQELLNLLGRQGSLSPDAHTLLGAIYADQGDYGSAISELAAAIEQSDGRAPEARARLGDLLWELGREDEAVQYLNEISPDETSLPALVASGQWHARRNEPEEAEKYFTSAIRQARDSAEDLLQVGKVLLLRAQPDLAVRELRRAIAARPDGYPEAELYLGTALFQQGELQASADVLNRAINHRQGNYPAARLALGMTLYQQRAYNESLAELRAALRLRGGNYPQAELMLGLVLADVTVGQFEEANQQLEQAVAHHQDKYSEAERALGLLQFFRLGQPQEARKTWTVLTGSAAPKGHW
jgi:serine/threonine protein kinase/Tfp pilus assembly protein PilF